MNPNMHAEHGTGQTQAQGQAQPQPLARPSQQTTVYQPEHMRNLTVLSEVDRDKYERGLRMLYETLEKNPPESTDHQEARQKIIDFSSTVHSKVQSILRGQQHVQNHANAHGLASSVNWDLRRQLQSNIPQGNGQPQMAQIDTMASDGSSGRTVQSATGGQIQSAGQSTQGKIPEGILRHVATFNVTAPPHVPDPQRWVHDMKQKYALSVIRAEKLKSTMRHLDGLPKEREAKGMEPFQGEELEKWQAMMKETRTEFVNTQRFLDQFRQRFPIKQQTVGGGDHGGGPQQRPQQSQNAGSAMQVATASVSAAMEVAKNQHLGGVNRQQQPLHASPQQHQTDVSHQGSMSLSTSSAAHTAPATQANMEASHNHHPAPLQINTGNAQASDNRAAMGTPTQNVNMGRGQNQGATPTTAGGIARPLTHQAAITLAAQRNNSSVPFAVQPNSAGDTTTPGSAGLMGNATHSHAHPPPSANISGNRMPIPKTLPDAARNQPQPVPNVGGVNPGRPTLGSGSGLGGGTTAQPVIQKTAVLHFEAEGEHVLSKKKLDELVRLVSGGGPPGQDGNYLTADVEESVLTVADNIFEDVANAACIVAKERGSKVLESRDIQLVLERNYNIRIAGLSSDELRTTRKVQPNASWYAKMSAVQAAKINPPTKHDN